MAVTLRRGSLHLGLMLVVSGALAGCGGSQAGTTTRTQQVAPTTAPATTPTTTTATTTTTTAASVAPTTAEIGSLTYSGSGTKYTETYRVGPILYGKDNHEPEASADAACSDSSSDWPTEAFIYGVVQMSYVQGSVPLTMSADSDSAQNSVDTSVFPNPLGEYAVDLNQQWICPNIADQNGGNAASFTLQPGGSITLPFWIFMPQVISNANPTITAKQANVISIQIPLGASQTTTTLSASGPHAANCANNGIALLPYATLPLRSESCTSADGASQPITP